jgi:hypothetical protein
MVPYDYDRDQVRDRDRDSVLREPDPSPYI